MVWSIRADSSAFVCSVPKVEKAEKRTHPRVRERKNRLATTGGEKVVGKSAWKCKSGGIVLKVFENNGDRAKRWGEEKRVGVG